ncbi:putative zinc finger protein, partial [Orchesella cincta]
VEGTSLCVDGGGAERCPFCAVPLPPSFTVVHGKLTRLKTETADDRDIGSLSNSGSFLSTENSLVDKQLEVIFILRNILQTPEKKLHQFIKQFGGQLHPEFWFQVCSVCREPVQRFFETLQAISELKKKLTRISKQLKGRIYNTKDVGGAEEGLTCIWEEIRAEVVKDLYRAPVGVEKKTSNQQGTPVDDGDEHMPTSEVRPETVLPDGLPPTVPEEDDKDDSHSDFEPDGGDNEDFNSSSRSDSSEDEKFKPPKRKPVLKRKSNPNSNPDFPPKLKKKSIAKLSRRKGRPAADPSRQYTISRKGSTSYYKCNLCSAIRNPTKRMITHLSCHEKGEGSTCTLCGWLVHPGGMNRHNSHFHPEQNPKEKKKVYFYTCPKCPARSHDHTFMERHLPLHVPSNTEETTTCKFCGWLVPTKRLGVTCQVLHTPKEYRIKKPGRKYEYSRRRFHFIAITAQLSQRGLAFYSSISNYITKTKWSMWLVSSRIVETSLLASSSSAFIWRKITSYLNSLPRKKRETGSVRIVSLFSIRKPNLIIILQKNTRVFCSPVPLATSHSNLTENIESTWRKRKLTQLPKCTHVNCVGKASKSRILQNWDWSLLCVKSVGLS